MRPRARKRETKNQVQILGKEGKQRPDGRKEERPKQKGGSKAKKTEFSLKEIRAYAQQRAESRDAERCDENKDPVVMPAPPQEGQTR